MSSTPAPIGVDSISMDLTLGITEVSVLVASMLYGMALLQVFTYAMNCSSDPHSCKALVAVIWLLDTAHTACLSSGPTSGALSLTAAQIELWVYLYYITVSNFGDRASSVQFPIIYDVSLLVSGLLTVIVQTYFTYRIWVLSRKYTLVIPIYILEIFRAVMAIGVIPITALHFKDVVIFQDKYSYTIYMSLAASSVIDTVNTAALCLYLRRRKTMFSNTAHILNGIMLWALETGILTTAVAVVVLVAWGTMPKNRFWTCFLAIYTKLYSISILASLNAPAKHRDENHSCELAKTSIVPARAPNFFNFPLSELHSFHKSSNPISRSNCMTVDGQNKFAVTYEREMVAMADV